jgi:poly(beta-D-mannuronate) lyase
MLYNGLRTIFRIVYMVFLLMIATPVMAANSKQYLKTPFDDLARQVARVDRVTLDSGGLNCFVANIPSPPADMLFTSRYSRDDPSHSTIDDDLDAMNREQTGPLLKFEEGVSNFADLYLQGQHNADSCVMEWLDKWASVRALLATDINEQGRLSRVWLLGSSAAAFARIRFSPDLELKQKKRVWHWLRDLAHQVKIDYLDNPLGGSRRPNNRIYWAAWAVGITGATLNVPELYQSAVNADRLLMTDALYGIQDNGTLPLELGRKSRALSYHYFAAAPLIAVADLAYRNGENLFTAGDGALHRLAGYTLKGLADPASIAEITGAQQDLTFLKNKAGGAWLNFYRCYATNDFLKATDYYAENYGYAAYARLGGDIRNNIRCPKK